MDISVLSRILLEVNILICYTVMQVFFVGSIPKSRIARLKHMAIFNSIDIAIIKCGYTVLCSKQKYMKVPFYHFLTTLGWTLLILLVLFQMNSFLKNCIILTKSEDVHHLIYWLFDLFFFGVTFSFSFPLF